MSVSILQFPGTNCEKDMEYAYKKLGAKIHIIWHKEHTLPSDTRLVVLAGGFSYGDFLRSGAIAANSPIISAVVSYANSGGLVLGICNGFQILCESALLPGALIRNDGLHFISQFQALKVANNDNKFLAGYDRGSEIIMPIAHADGRYFADSETLKSLHKNHQILLTYAPNPNGSLDGIAGICNEGKNVFGLMPHPERAIERILGGEDGLQMLANLIK